MNSARESGAGSRKREVHCPRLLRHNPVTDRHARLSYDRAAPIVQAPATSNSGDARPKASADRNVRFDSKQTFVRCLPLRPDLATNGHS